MITDAMVEATRNRLHRFGYTTIDRDMARAALEAAERAAWQPIETAVWDGTPFLVYCPKRGVLPPLFVLVDSPGVFTEGLTAVRRPTHWRPLPAPPPNTAEVR